MLLALGLGAFVLALGPAATADDAGCPAKEPCVVVHFVGNAQPDQVVTVADLADSSDWIDVSGATYDLLHSDGSAAPSQTVPSGVSIGNLLAELGVPGAGVTYTELTRAGSTASPSRLDNGPGAHQLGPSGQNGFVDGLRPVLYLFSNDVIGYLRPQTGPEDANFDDSPSSAFDGRLDLTVHTTGQVVHPTIQASAMTLDAGKTVTLTAAVDGTAGDYSYTWDFGDGESGAGTQVTHSWDSASGTDGYEVRVTATDESSVGTASADIVVTVPDSPPPNPHHPGSGGSGDHHSPTTGPTHSHGHQGGATPDPTADPAADNGAQGTHDAPGTVPSSATPPKDQQHGTAHASDADGHVTGIVLTGSDIAAQAESGAPVTAPAARSGTHDVALRLPGWVGLVGAALVLLGAGALSESRWLRQRLARRTGMMRA